MRRVIIFLANTGVAILAAILLFNQFTPAQNTPVKAESSSIPQLKKAPPGQPVTHLTFLTEPQDANKTTYFSRELLAYPRDQISKNNAQALAENLLSTVAKSACIVERILASPNRQYLAQEFNCHAGGYITVHDLTHDAEEPITIPRSYFLDWSPDGEWFLARNFDADEVWLIAADDSQRTLLELPFGTYTASFTPDARQITFAASRGLGFGSELGTLDLAKNQYAIQQQFPDQIVAYPRWSPAGSVLAYILLADNNIPFTVGELWLADGTGTPQRKLDDVDAGHGYAPAWMPNGRSLTYIIRENPHSVRANHDTAALHSNIAAVEVASGTMTKLTDFNESHVYDPAWSPDGKQLAFVVNDAVWQLETGKAPVQVSENGVKAAHPAWLVAPVAQ